MKPLLPWSAVCALVALLGGCGDSAGIAEPPKSPVITAQPQDVAVNPGASATFSVTATGGAPLSYQWKRDGASISGATSSSYTLTAAAADGGARFSVAVTNAVGTVESNQALLTVRTAPVITAQPEARTVLSGVPARFSVSATGSDLTYQWHRNGVAIPGATASSYAVGVPLAGDDGAQYSVTVANGLGSVASSSASLRVNTGTGLRPTSYANAKGANREPVQIPTGSFNARAYGDFFGASGSRDFFVSTLVYDMTRPQSEARPGESQFWRWTGSSYQPVTGKVDDVTGCLHPRKALVADYNGDKEPDIFVVCHGYDAAPFPGEPNYVLLSRPSGVYTRKTVAGGAGFYHSGTALDVNNDGAVDVLVTNSKASNAVVALINDGQGNFSTRTGLFPFGQANYFTIEAADVNGDGLIDVLAGGHDWEGAETTVLINDGSGSFATSPRIELPRVAKEGVVLDFAVLDADHDGVNEIYVLRTSGGDGTFYQSRTVQRVTFPSRGSTTLVSERPATWVDYLVPVFSGAGYSLVSDHTTVPFSVRLH